MAVGSSLLCGHAVLQPVQHKSPASPSGSPSLQHRHEPTSTWQNKSPCVRWCLLRQVDHLGLEETPHRELYMCRSLRLLPCIRAEGPQLGEAQLKKCSQHLPVAWSCLEQASVRSTESLSACKPWPTCGELDSSAREALPEENAHLC